MKVEIRKIEEGWAGFAGDDKITPAFNEIKDAYMYAILTYSTADSTWQITENDDLTDWSWFEVR